ncbi:MAG: ComEA family DNA-binding protein [Armatimonadota bacterium]
MENPNWRQVLASILGISVLGVIGYLGGARAKTTPNPAPNQKLQSFVGSAPSTQATPQPEAKGAEPKEAKKIVLDIGGAISKPGVYWLYEGARLDELVVLAGGLLPTADRERINLAQPLKDGSKVSIPFRQLPSSQNSTAAPMPSAPEGPDSSPNEPELPAQPRVVNINQATVAELEALPAIGHELAGRIVTYREGIGGFKSIEEVKQVRGIGEKLFEKIRPFLTL